MPTSSLFYRDKFKFLTNAYTNTQEFGRNIRDYVDKSIPARFKSISNIFNITVDVVQDISTLHMLHHEDLTNELNVFTAQHNGNLRGMAQLSGHQPVLPMSSNGVVKMSISKTGLREFGSRVILAENASFRCKSNGLVYSMLREQPIRIQTNSSFIHVELLEGVRKNQTFVVDGNTSTTGDNLYTTHLDDTGSIEHEYMKVYVNNELWTEYDSLRDMSSDTKGYLKRVGYGSQLDITFGNDISGRRLKLGNMIKIEYLLTNGERGNVPLETEFELIDGLRDIQGHDINAREYFKIVKESGFMLGSDGESADVTRAMTGWASRSGTFARPEYVVEFLSRLSILSYVSAWTEADNLIFNVLCLPKLTLSSDRDYFIVPDNKLLLNDIQIASIKNMLMSSGKQWVSTSFTFVQPTVRKYAMIVYIEGNAYDKSDLKLRIENVIAKIMLNKTYGDVSKDISNNSISKSDFINAIYDLPEVDSVGIDIISDQNETAIIEGSYIAKRKDTDTKAIRVERINVINGISPNLGLSDLGDIITDDNEVPVLRGNFKMHQADAAPVLLPNNPITVMIKQNGEWTSL